MAALQADAGADADPDVPGLDWRQHADIDRLLEACAVEEELDPVTWQAQAPEIEPGSYLWDSSGFRLGPVSQTVVYVKDGFVEQFRVTRHAWAQPRWSSLTLRRDQASGAGDGRPLALGDTETCTITGATFHRRLLDPPAFMRRSMKEEARQNLQHAELRRVVKLVMACAVLRAYAAVCKDRLQTESSMQRLWDSPALNQAASSLKGQYFVRLRLQRCQAEGAQPGPLLSTTIDHFVDAGVGEWIVPEWRYRETVFEHRFRTGDRVSMFWADDPATGRGDWWQGTVQRYVRGPVLPPPLTTRCHGSLWAGVRVRWDGTVETDDISPWELTPILRRADPIPRRALARTAATRPPPDAAPPPPAAERDGRCGMQRPCSYACVTPLPAEVPPQLTGQRPHGAEELSQRASAGAGGCPAAPGLRAAAANAAALLQTRRWLRGGWH